MMKMNTNLKKTLLPLSIAMTTAGGVLVTKNHVTPPQVQGQEIVVSPQEKMLEGSLLGLGILGLGASAAAKRKEDEELNSEIEEPQMTAEKFAKQFYEECMDLVPELLQLKDEKYTVRPYRQLLELINNSYGVCYDQVAKEELERELQTLINYEGCEGAKIKANDKINDIVYLMEKVSSPPEKWELRRQKYPQNENDPNMPLDVYEAYKAEVIALDKELGENLYLLKESNIKAKKLAKKLVVEISTHGISSKEERNKYLDLLTNVLKSSTEDYHTIWRAREQWNHTACNSFSKYNPPAPDNASDSDGDNIVENELLVKMNIKTDTQNTEPQKLEPLNVEPLNVEPNDNSRYLFDANGMEVGGVDKEGHAFVTENLQNGWKVRKTADGIQHYVKDDKELYTYKFDNNTQLPIYKYNIEQGEIERHDGVKVIVTGNTKDREIKNIEIYPNGVKVENYAGCATSKEIRSVQLNPDGSRVENYGHLHKSYKIFNQTGVHVGGLDCLYGKYVVDKNGRRIYKKDDDSDNSGSSNNSSSTSTPSIISTPTPQDNNAMAIAAQMLGIDVKDLQGVNGVEVNGVTGANGVNGIIRPKTNKAKQKKNTTTKLTFADIGGQDEAIEKMKKTILYPIKYPDIYKNQKISHGVILYGPPGTGKSLIAEALANETDASFIKLNGLELESKFVGESEKQWRELFDKARKQQPCIIFLDEFEAVCGKRGRNSSSDSSDKVVNQILTLLSDIEKNGENIFLVCATNRLDMIDDAIARSGRLETHIEITAPKTIDDIKKIFDIHTKNIALADDIDKDKISEDLLKHKATGADIASIVALAKEKSFERKDEYGLNIYDRMENGLLTKDAVEKLKVTNQDFEDAIKEKYNKSGEGSAPRKIGFGG